MSLLIRIDPDAWSHIYGTAPEGIDEDVKRYAVTQIVESPAGHEGAIVTARRAA